MAGLVDALHDPEMERIKLQMAQSQAMRQPKQGSRGEMVGRVRTVGNQAGDILGGIVSPFIEQRALDEAKALTEGRQKAEQDWMGRMPSDTYEATLPEGVAGPVGTVNKTPKQLADETRRWGAEGAAMPYSPLARAVAAKGMDYAMNAPQRMAELDERNTARTEDREARLLSAKEMVAQRAADKAEAEAIRAADKKTSDELYRRTAADQNAHLTRTLAMLEGRNAARDSKAAQETPAQAKARLAQEGKAAASERAGTLLDDMDTQINVLDKNRDIPSTERGVLSNAVSALQGTGLGQTLGKAAGTYSQKARNSISNIALNLVLELKGLKGLGASQMNSNMELQKYLEAVGGGEIFDAGTMRANIERARGLLGAAKAKESGTGGVAGANDEAMAWANANPDDPRSAQIKARLGAK